MKKIQVRKSSSIVESGVAQPWEVCLKCYPTSGGDVVVYTWY